jgi:hypothetical protein
MLQLFVHQHASLDWPEAKRVLPASDHERDPVRAATAVRWHRRGKQVAMNDTLQFLIILGIVVGTALLVRWVWRALRGNDRDR